MSQAASLADRLTVVLVEPAYSGNVGHAARSMMNFGVTRLALVNPVRMDEEGRNRAVHAQRVLDEARHFASFREAADEFDYLVAFSARVSPQDKSHLRNPVPFQAVAPALAAIDGRIALVFGREADGLFNDEVEACDAIAKIPTSPMYPSLNLSHAVTVALYELFREAYPVHTLSSASHRDKELLHRTHAATLDALGFPGYRRDVTSMMFRRVIGRAGLTRWEYHRMMGVFSTTLKRLGKWPVKDLPDLPPFDEDEPPPG